MSFRRVLADAAPDGETVLTIGVFDGVHRGHRHLLDRLIRRSRPGFRSAVVTFSNHPSAVLRPDHPVSFLTTPEDKMGMLREHGIDLVIPLEFTPELSQVGADEFARLLVDSLNMKGLVVGPDFAFGRGRQGNEAYLTEVGRELGFWVETVEPLLVDGGPVRSRRIRDAVSGGGLAMGNLLLGRKFQLAGEVVRGDGRGRDLGFPTANVNVPGGMLLPGDAIYATWALVDGQRLPSATSIGIRPTFDLTERLVEVYIMDFAEDLYGKTIGVEFVERLREQEKFSGIDALIHQVNQDVADARRSLAADEGVRIG